MFNSPFSGNQKSEIEDQQALLLNLNDHILATQIKPKIELEMLKVSNTIY